MLYLIFQPDLRSRYNEARWLNHDKMWQEQKYTPDDVVLISEWMVPDRTEMLDLLRSITRQGARVVYVGAEATATEEWRRQLVMLGIYDFYFADTEIVLGRIDDLIEHPRTMKDVKQWAPFEQIEAMPDMPTVVDEFIVSDDEADEAAATILKEVQSEEERRQRMSLVARMTEQGADMFRGLRRTRRDEGPGEEQEATQEDTPKERPRQQTRRVVVWKNPDPIEVRIVGQPGSGKTFVAWNLATLLDQRKLATAVVEDRLMPMSLWTDVKDGIHLYQEQPKKGYKVHLYTGSSEWGNADLYIVVSFPDRYRIEQMTAAMMEQRIPAEKVMWIINHHVPGMPIPAKVSNYISIPHDVRQLNATLMQKPLCVSDAKFAALFEPIVEHISALYIEHAKGGPDTDVAIAGV